MTSAGTITAWRIVQKPRADTAFTGQGAAIYPGRWNTAGTPIVYTAESRALALLEILANLSGPPVLNRYVLIPVRFAEGLCQSLSAKDLPRQWDATPPVEATRKLGAAWCRANTSAALRVPSVLVPEESNYLLNPRHPDFRKMRIGEAVGIRMDARLVRSRSGGG